MKFAVIIWLVLIIVHTKNQYSSFEILAWNMFFSICDTDSGRFPIFYKTLGQHIDKTHCYQI